MRTTPVILVAMLGATTLRAQTPDSSVAKCDMRDCRSWTYVGASFLQWQNGSFHPWSNGSPADGKAADLFISDFTGDISMGAGRMRNWNRHLATGFVGSIGGEGVPILRAETQSRLWLGGKSSFDLSAGLFGTTKHYKQGPQIFGPSMAAELNIKGVGIVWRANRGFRHELDPLTPNRPRDPWASYFGASAQRGVDPLVAAGGIVAVALFRKMQTSRAPAAVLLDRR